VADVFLLTLNGKNPSQCQADLHIGTSQSVSPGLYLSYTASRTISVSTTSFTEIEENRIRGGTCLRGGGPAQLKCPSLELRLLTYAFLV